MNDGKYLLCMMYYQCKLISIVPRSLLIRYPYELTVRGVLKYQILPFIPSLSQLHSVRVCKMARVDPSTGQISDNIPIPEKSICDDPSPIEGSNA